MNHPMNDRLETTFSQWLIDIEIDRLLGEIDLVLLDQTPRIFETDDLDLDEAGPEIEGDLDENGFFIPF